MNSPMLTQDACRTIDRPVYNALIIGELVFLEDPFIPRDTFWRIGQKVSVTPEMFEKLRTEADEATYRKILRMTEGLT